MKGPRIMPIKPLSLQLYSLREASSIDFPNVLKRVAEMGYAGVEPAGFYGLDPAEFHKIVSDLGMVISSSHSPWCTPESVSSVIDVAGVLGTRFVTCGFGPDAFASMNDIKRTTDTVNGMLDQLEGSGLTLIQHNHAWEFETLDGRIKYDIYTELCPRVQLELDIYWAANFGEVNPAEQVVKFASKTPFLHIKDGNLERNQPMLPAGQGKIDIPACIHAADPDVLQWLIVELDHFDGDMFSAVEQSYLYLTENGLAKGRC